MTRIAVLGLGAMGLPMATNLVSNGYDTAGFDVNQAQRVAALEQGVQAVETVKDAVENADIVLVAVRNATQLEYVLFDPSTGAAQNMRRNSTIILTSTVGIPVVEKIALELEDYGIGLVDAPISGGPVRAGKGELLVVVGAKPDVYESVLPVLEAMSTSLVKVGDEPGKGQALKTVNQLLCGIHIAAAGEAMALAKRLGLDQLVTLNALMDGAAASFMLGDRGQRMMEADPEVKSRLDIFVKDMGIVTSAAKACGMAVPVAAAAEQEYLLGLARGLGALDDSTVTRVVSPQDLV